MQYSRQSTLKLHACLDLDSPRTNRACLRLGFLQDLQKLKKPQQLIESADEEMYLDVRYDFYLRRIFKMLMAVKAHREKFKPRNSKELSAKFIFLEGNKSPSPIRKKKTEVSEIQRILMNQTIKEEEKRANLREEIFSKIIKTTQNSFKNTTKNSMHKEVPKVVKKQSSHEQTIKCQSVQTVKFKKLIQRPLLVRSQSRIKYLQQQKMNQQRRLLINSCQKLQMIESKVQKARDVHNTTLRLRVRQLKHWQARTLMTQQTFRVQKQETQQAKLTELTNRIVNKIIRNKKEDPQTVHSPTLILKKITNNSNHRNLEERFNKHKQILNIMNKERENKRLISFEKKRLISEEMHSNMRSLSLKNESNLEKNWQKWKLKCNFINSIRHEKQLIRQKKIRQRLREREMLAAAWSETGEQTDKIAKKSLMAQQDALRKMESFRA